MDIQYKATLNREEDLFCLYNSLGWSSFLKLDETQLAKAMNQSYYVIYAYDGDRLVGTGRVVSDGVINAYLCGLGVEQAYRSMGIGKEIVRLLVEYCKNNKLHIQLLCEEALISYYSAMGFNVFTVGMKLK